MGYLSSVLRFVFAVCWWVSLSTGAWAELTLLKDRGPNQLSNAIGFIDQLDGFNYFVATESDGHYLYKTDGTVAGTSRLKNLSVAAGYRVVRQSWSVAKVGKRLFFTTRELSSTSQSSRQIWVTDGTPEGSTLIKSVASDDAGCRLTLTPLATGVLFPETTSTNVCGLFFNQGTSISTVPVVFSDPSETGPFSAIGLLNAFPNGTALFVARSLNGTSVSLWVTDGTTLGTKLVRKEILLASQRSDFEIAATSPTILQGSLLPSQMFLFFDALHGPALWRSDGTVLGTAMVADIDSEKTAMKFLPVSSALPGKQLFVTEISKDSLNDRSDLWVSDGASMTRLADFPFDSSFRSILSDFSAAEGRVYFRADYYQYFSGGTSVALKVEIWSTDGTIAGTSRLKEFKEVSDLRASSNGLFVSADGEFLFNSLGTTNFEKVFSKPKLARIETLGGLLLLAGDTSSASTARLWSSPQRECAPSSSKAFAGVCGCGVLDVDSDGDATPDCKDRCPFDAKKSLSVGCGCGLADVDSDGDGSYNCVDQCPNDPKKTRPGFCPCGYAEVDVDANGVVDCLENILGQLVPQAPSVSVSGGHVRVDAPAPNNPTTPIALSASVQYEFLVRVRFSAKEQERRGRRGYSYSLLTSLPGVTIDRPVPRGSKIAVRYRYRWTKALGVQFSAYSEMGRGKK